jgi:stage II sporulation protein D
MKIKLIAPAAAIALCLTSVCAPTLRAQNFDVRVYTAHPPATIIVAATSNSIAWRTCPTCPDTSAPNLSIAAAKSALTLAATQSAAPQPIPDLYISGDYRLQPPSGTNAPPFSANFPLHIRAVDGQLLIIVTMPIEQYVAAVLAAESGDSKQSESLKAMAVAIRTYALRFRGKHSPEGFDFCDTTHCQAMSWNAVTPRISAAVAATQGQSLAYNGAPAETYYHQNCGGTTAAASESWPDNHAPYLIAHADPYCVANGALKWQTTISVADIDRSLRDAGLSLPAHWTTLEVDTRTASGRTQRLKLAGGSPGDIPLSASSLRFAVNRELGWNKIRSDLYEVRNSGGQVYFSGRGSGHGVGLCQAGAEEMAREGKSYREILAFYYPGTQLVTARADNWQKQSSERFDLLSANPQTDAAILPIADRILKDDERSIGWQLAFRPQLQIFPTLDAYRDTTGEPGWVAASVRGHTVRLQPLLELQRKEIVESTLRHEFFHLLVESRAKADTPLWYREGLVLYLSDPGGTPSNASALTNQQMEAILLHPPSRDAEEKAYAVAQRRIADLVFLVGRQTLLAWLSTGIPAGVIAGPPQFRDSE